MTATPKFDDNCLKDTTAWEASEYGTFSGPYLRRKSPYSVQMQENMDQKKLHI